MNTEFLRALVAYGTELDLTETTTFIRDWLDKYHPRQHSPGKTSDTVFVLHNSVGGVARIGEQGLTFRTFQPRASQIEGRREAGLGWKGVEVPTRRV